jgi:NNP family nitrate/nitrite transporter-like MFS transporter
VLAFLAHELLTLRHRVCLNDGDGSLPKIQSLCAEITALARCHAAVRGCSMKFAEFKKAGHWPTLLAAFLYFDISFMAWVALGPLIVYIVQDMNLAVDEKFTLVAIPVLAGALLRVPMGLLADLYGAKRTGIVAQIIVIAATAWVCYFGLPSKLSVEIFGLALGIGGASFAVALPQASRWYPPQYQGVVMGIAGAGNMGVVLDTMFAPSIAEHWGWQAVFGVLRSVLLILAYVFAAKDARAKPISLSLRRLAARPRQSLVHVLLLRTFGFVGLVCDAAVFHRAVSCVRRAAGLLSGLDRRVRFGLPAGRRLIADRIGGIRSLSIFLGSSWPRTSSSPSCRPTRIDACGLVRSQMPRIAWCRCCCSRSACSRAAWAMAQCFAHSAPLPPRDRPDDGHGRLRRRHRRLLPCQDARRRQGNDRRFGAGFVFSACWRCLVSRTCHGQSALAHHLGRRIGSAGLTTRC